MIGFAKVSYQFTDWLSAFGRIGTDVLRRDTESVNQAGHHFYTSGRLTFGTSKVQETNADFLLMANRDIMDDLNLNVNAWCKPFLQDI